MEYILLATVFLPMAGALFVFGPRAQARMIALATTLATLGLTAILIAKYPIGSNSFALFDVPWLGAAGGTVDIHFSIGLDGLSLWLFGLTALLLVVAVLVSWEAIAQRWSIYYGLLLLLETGMLGVFVARDIILFYVFFEFTLVPLFFLIGVWGYEERRYAAGKFFVFTLVGGVLTFLSLLAIVLWDSYHPISNAAAWPMTFSIPLLTQHFALRPLSPEWLQVLIFFGLFAGFAVKTPLFPLHTWLPLAHTQAPTAGSILLAGVLLKIGTYGFVRFAVPMLPQATGALMPLLLWLSVAGIVYGALVALAQADMKRLIAYSSVSHLGFCMLGVFALTRLSVQGGVLQMINHGLSTGGLFAVVGMLYERYHTRQISDFGGIARQMPILASFMVVLTLSSIGLPGLNGFAGEFLLLLGTFQRAFAGAPSHLAMQYAAIAILATSGVVLGAWYMLQLVQRVFFGPLREPSGESGHHVAASPARDLSVREVLALTPLLVFILWIGLWPQFFLSRISPTLDPLISRAADAYDARLAAPVGVPPLGGFSVDPRLRGPYSLPSRLASATTVDCPSAPGRATP
ncbi:MAG: complex I subunit 4 family protein [Thermoguttaceae bacterium]